jgi:hypothetical protein
MEEVTFVVAGVYAVTIGPSILLNCATNAANSLLHETMAEIKQRNFIAMLRMDANLAN